MFVASIEKVCSLLGIFLDGNIILYSRIEDCRAHDVVNRIREQAEIDSREELHTTESSQLIVMTVKCALQATRPDVGDKY